MKNKTLEISMKRTKYIFAAAALMAASLSACGAGKSGNESEKDKLKIVTTIFPEYDWVMNILGENKTGAEVTMLLDKGVDMHSYQISVQDIMKISSCDMFIYVGGESDEWVEDALKEAKNKDMIVIDLLEELGDKVKEEEVKEGMQEEDEHDHEEETEYDEHVWLSVKNAGFLTQRISEKLQKMDEKNAEKYKANTKAYVEKLEALDSKYSEAVSGAKTKTLLFGDRFPFRYLTDDYGLDYYAAFVGCSAETEASFETITFLAGKTDELSLPVVMTIEGTDHRIAETIINNTEKKDQKILTMDSMQSVTSKDVKGGVTYLSVMEKNLEVLKEALN